MWGHCAAGVTSSHGTMHKEETRSCKNDFKNQAEVSTELFKVTGDVKAYDTVKNCSWATISALNISFVLFICGRPKERGNFLAVTELEKKQTKPKQAKQK